MSFQVTQNVFNKGLNKDTDHRVQDSSTYRDAKNISVMGDGDFFSAKNIAGSKKVQQLLNGDPIIQDINVLGAFECIGTFFSYGNVERNPAIIIFYRYVANVATGGPVDKIVLYDIKRDKLHTLLTTTNIDVNSDGEALLFPSKGTIDAVVFGEKNFDTIYFDDHTNPLRDFDITDQPIPNARVLTTRPIAPVDEISYVGEENGSGENASGTYQFSYRYYNTITKRYSAWSLLTLPIPLYPLGYEDVDTLDSIYGGVPNESTRKSIILKVEKTAEYALNFDAIQLAVIKNTGGLKTPPATAFLTSVRKDWFDSPDEIVYDGQGLETNVDSGEIVTEDAAIESAKTLVAKDNILFRGNIKYLDRTVDNLTFANACTISKKLGTAGTRYSLLDPNTNNPTFNNIDGSAPGLQATDGAGNPVNTRYVLGYNGFLDIRNNGGGLFNSNVQDGRVEGNSVYGDVPDDRINLTIPNNIQPGNEVFLRVGADKVGMREWPAIGPGNDEWGFNVNTLGKIDENGGFDASFLQGFIDFLEQGLLLTFLLGPNERREEYQQLLDSFRYVIQEGDTPESVARNIQTQISGRISSYPEAIRLERNGATLSFRTQNTETTPSPNLINDNWRPLIYVEYGMANGIDITVQDDEEELNDLINNPDSTFGGYKNPLNAHRFKGHFRNEVYRYGGVYMDKYGNWSRPVPFDFTPFMARNETGDTFAIGTINEQETSDGRAQGLTRISLFTSAHGIERGDLVKLQLGPNRFEYTEVRGGSSTPNPTIELVLGGSHSPDLGFTPVLFKLQGGEFSWAEKGTDWKYPERKNFKFPMMSSFDDDGVWDENNTFINPIGLKIEGITDHPSWAVAFAVVRVRRLKNIIWQSPAIAGQAVMPALLGDNVYDACTSPVAGSSPIGTYGPKSFAKGVSFNIDRENPSIGITVSGVRRVRPLNNDSNIPKIITVVPPEYMYQNDGVNFGSGLIPSGARLEIVDAVSFFRTWEFDVDGSGADDGDNTGDQLAFGIRADNAYNYYYKDTTGFLDTNTYPYSSPGNGFAKKQIPDNGKTRALFYGEVVNLGEAVNLPAPPNDLDFRTKAIVTYGNLEATSSFNCSNEVTLQKSICILTEENFGDFSYFARQKGADNTLLVNGVPVGVPDFNFYEEPQRAGATLPGNRRFNVGKSGFEIRGNELIATGTGNRITDLVDGASAVAPIVNLVRDIADDRYGDLEDVHQYIHTGAYAKISSSSDLIDLEVWGGDCFISKHAAKISDTHLDNTNEGLEGNASGRIFSYNDFQEVLMVYLESTVNCDLQAGQFHYPVLQRQALQVFAPSYEYPYNPGYSIENELKVFTSRDNLESDRFEFPARIVFSDQKIFQTDVKGFDRFRAFSFYDLPEDYGGITKLTKLPNDNVYVIQDHAVAVLPINKNVIEDSTGGQLVVNSGTLINQPSYIMNENGSQHIRSVVNSDTSIFFMDAESREVFKIGGNAGEGKISENGLHSEFLRLLKSESGIPDYKVVANYDFNNLEYWIGVNTYEDVDFSDGGASENIIRPTFHFIWSDKIGAWMTEVSLDSSTQAKYLVYSHSLPYVIGSESNGALSIDELYTGDIKGRILGSDNESSIKFVINPEEPQGKTFDILRIDSSERLSRAEAIIHRENGQAPLETEINLNRRPRHDSYEVPMLLAQNNQRMRGKACEITFFMENGNDIEVKIMNVLTKYRFSSRIFR